MFGKKLKIALNILNIKEKEICPVYMSKVNLNCEKIVLLRNPNKEKKACIVLQ